MKTERESSKDMPRILLLDALLSDGGYHPLSEMETLTGKAEATVKRDIASLRSLNAPIEYDTFNMGYHYTNTVYRLPATFISGEDIAIYGIVSKMFMLYRDTPLWKPLRDILDTLESPVENQCSTTPNSADTFSLAKGDLPCGSWFEDRIVIASRPEVKVSDDDWKIILNALMHNTKIEFDYTRSYDNKTTHRMVQPWQLVFDEQNWFITGFCELRKERRMFLLNAISNLKPVAEHFVLPPNDEYKLDRRSIGKFGASIGGEVRDYRILLKDGSFVSAGEQWASDWKSESYHGPLTDSPYAAVVTFRSNQHIQIMRWVLSHGEDAVPLAPEEFVVWWKKHIDAMKNISAKVE